jgi:hypothetical protein
MRGIHRNSTRHTQLQLTSEGTNDGGAGTPEDAVMHNKEFAMSIRRRLDDRVSGINRESYPPNLKFWTLNLKAVDRHIGIPVGLKQGVEMVSDSVDRYRIRHVCS